MNHLLGFWHRIWCDGDVLPLCFGHVHRLENALGGTFVHLVDPLVDTSRSHWVLLGPRQIHLNDDDQ